MKKGPFDYNIDGNDSFNIREKRMTPLERRRAVESDMPTYNIVGNQLNFDEEHYEFEGKSKDIKECNVDFSRRRVNISQRGKKYGHFYHLLSEYESILSAKCQT